MAEYIDREKLRNGLYSKIDFFHQTGLFNLSKECSRAIKYIDKQPAADVVEVKHGEWVGCGTEYIWGNGKTYDIWSCTNCKRTVFFKGEKPIWSYCPNCGAKMDGGKAE